MDRCFQLRMPVRKIPKSYRNVTGISANTKATGQAQFESPLERDFISLLEFSLDVCRYEVQPLRIEWIDSNGDPRSYTPDVLVEFRPDLGWQPWLCEVKLRSGIRENWTDLRPKFRRGIRYAKERGWRFRLMTEVEIRTPYLTNARFLKRYRKREVSIQAAETVLQTLRGLGKSTPAFLLQALAADPWEQAEWLPAIWYLVAWFRIGADLDSELAMASPIWSLS